jgi:hypothetical protein
MSWVFKNEGWVEEPGVGFSLGVRGNMYEDAHLEAAYEDRYGGGTLHDDISGPFLEPYVPYEDEEHEELDDEEQK